MLESCCIDGTAVLHVKTGGPFAVITLIRRFGMILTYSYEYMVTI